MVQRKLKRWEAPGHGRLAPVTIGASHCDQLEDTPQGTKIREHSFNSFILSGFYPPNGGKSRVISGLARKSRPRPRNQRARLTPINCAQTIMSIKINEADARAHPGAWLQNAGRSWSINEKTRARVRISHDDATETETRPAFAHAHASRLNQM